MADETYRAKPRAGDMQLDVLMRLDKTIAKLNNTTLPEGYKPYRFPTYNLDVLYRLDVIYSLIQSGGGGTVETVNDIGVVPGTKNIRLLASNIPCLIDTDPSNVQFALDLLEEIIDANYRDMVKGERTNIQDFNHFCSAGAGFFDIADLLLFNNLSIGGNNCHFYINTSDDVQFDCTNIDAFVQNNKIFTMLIYNTGVGTRVVDFSYMQNRTSEYVFMDSKSNTPAIFTIEDDCTAEISFLRVHNQHRGSDEIIVKYFNQLS